MSIPAEKNIQQKKRGSKSKIIIIIIWVLFVLSILSVGYFIYMVSEEKLGKLPSFEDLENPETDLATEVYSYDGVLLGKYFYENRSNAVYEELSPYLINALIATEDIRFYEHSGIDMQGLSAIPYSFLKGTKRGGSTITQQLAKNLFHEKPKTTLGRIRQKILEWFIAVKLEKSYTKEEIITMYFNTVPFGDNAYGIKSAAKTYFNTPPDSLKIEEAAILVGMLKATTYYNPRRNPENALSRRNLVISMMAKNNFILKKTADSLKTLPIELDYVTSDHNEGVAPYFRKILMLELKKWCKNNKKVDGTNYDIYKDGLKIYTSIDSRMQHYAEEAVKEHISYLQEEFYAHWKGQVPWAELPSIITDAVKRSERYRVLRKNDIPEDSIMRIFKQPVPMTVFSWRGDIDTSMSPLDSIKYYKYFLHTGFMSMDPKTGYIKAWVGGINHNYFKYDHVNIHSKRQVGSTFKPFVYTVAIDNAMSPCYEYPNVPITFEDYDNWTAQNASAKEYGGMLTLIDGLANSLNTVTAHVMYDFMPPSNVVNVAKSMGIKSDIPPYPSICLGTPDISVFEMVGAYSTFANKGFASKPIYYTRIEDKDGNLIQEFPSERTEAISEQTSYVMLYMLQQVINKGSGMRLRFRYELKNEIAGKTGTTQNGSDGWFIGIVPQLVSGGWVGCDDRSIHFRNLEFGQGASMALPIWALFMQKVYADKTLGISEEATFDKPKEPLTIELDCNKYKKENQQKTGINPFDPFE